MKTKDEFRKGFNGKKCNFKTRDQFFRCNSPKISFEGIFPLLSSINRDTDGSQTFLLSIKNPFPKQNLTYLLSKVYPINALVRFENSAKSV